MQAERAAIFAYGEDYKAFLDRAKTEREAVTEIEAQAGGRGFVELINGSAGPRTFYTYKGKTIILAVQGRRPLTQGLRLVASHIDSPRLDLKQYPITAIKRRIFTTKAPRHEDQDTKMHKEIDLLCELGDFVPLWLGSVRVPARPG